MLRLPHLHAGTGTPRTRTGDVLMAGRHPNVCSQNTGQHFACAKLTAIVIVVEFTKEFEMSAMLMKSISCSYLRICASWYRRRIR